MSSDPEKIKNLSDLITGTADTIVATANNMKAKRDEIIAATDTVAPSQVTGLTATTVSSSQINLTWNKVPEADVDHYLIRRGITQIGAVLAGANTYSDMALSAGTTYTYSVQAVDKSNNTGIASASVSATTSPGTTPPPPPPPTPTGLDKFGVRKIYPDASTPNEWYVNMDNPAGSVNFKNLPSISKQSDGSFQTSESQVRMEAWSPEGKKWLNVEITAYQKLVSGTPQYIFQLYRGGGHHSSLSPERSCWGAAYKAGLLSNGDTNCRKEVNHPAYCPNRGTMKGTTLPLTKMWVGYKEVVYNYVKNGKTFVKIETYIDDKVNDANGNLVIKNEWRPTAQSKDEGGWATTESDFTATCPPLNKDSTQQYRQRDEILNLPGGNTDLQNLCAFRTDGSTNNWKYLSVRAITPPTTVT